MTALFNCALLYFVKCIVLCKIPSCVAVDLPPLAYNLSLNYRSYPKNKTGYPSFFGFLTLTSCDWPYCLSFTMRFLYVILRFVYCYFLVLYLVYDDSFK